MQQINRFSSKEQKQNLIYTHNPPSTLYPFSLEQLEKPEDLI